MKKFMLHGFLAMLTASMIVGCGGGGGDTSDTSDTADTTKPVIALASDSNIVGIGRDYSDPGATATDNVDGNVNVSATGSVDTASLGEYTITYTATDSAGNAAVETRLVRVVPLINGVVYSYDTGLPLPDASISVGSQTSTTDANGLYSIAADPGAVSSVRRARNASDNVNSYVVTIRISGYAGISQIAQILSGMESTILNVDMLTVGVTAFFDASVGGNFELTSSLGNVGGIELLANSLVDRNGNQVTGEVRMELTAIDPSRDINLMPGDMTTDTGASLASVGAMIIEAFDSTGSALELASGQSATIRIPVSSRGDISMLSAEVGLYWFDESTGMWVEEGAPTLSDDGTYYEGTVDSMRTWNADYLYDSVNVVGCVEDINTSVRIENATIELTGNNYSGYNSVITDANGDFTIEAMQNAESLINANKLGQLSNTQVVYTGTEEYTMPECLKVGSTTASLTATLTWGENPRDLDTHLIGPNGFHIAYYSMVQDNTFLDVDDVSSFGPEVLTALSFPEAGTYHYSVYHFSGISTISASPARVEVVVNGQRYVFVPPAGQTDEEWWNVFDIIVDENGAISITTVNTWSDTAPGASGRLGKMVMPAKN